MKSFPKIFNVTARKNKIVCLEFDNGVTKIYDCKPLLENPVFEPLKDGAFFKNVHSDNGGYGIIMPRVKMDK
jgi:hypothetical protein